MERQASAMIPENNFTGNKDAVSEVVGFILIFGMVVLAAGIIYAFGYPVLQANMESSVFESSEQSFVVLQSHIKAVAFEQTPVRTMKLKLQSATLSHTNESFIRLNYGGNNTTIPLGRIEYLQGRKKLVYECGGVFKSYPDGPNVLVSDPSVYSGTVAGDDVVSIGIVSLKGNYGSAAEGLVTLAMKHNSSTLIRDATPTTLILTVNSTVAPVWRDYLEEQGLSIISSSDNEVVARKNNTSILIGEHVVDVEVR